MKIRNNYFIPDPLTHLSKSEILVFGTTINGEHKAGAAKIAYEKFGAKWGVAMDQPVNAMPFRLYLKDDRILLKKYR